MEGEPGASDHVFLGSTHVTIASIGVPARQSKSRRASGNQLGLLVTEFVTEERADPVVGPVVVYEFRLLPAGYPECVDLEAHQDDAAAGLAELGRARCWRE